MDIQPTILIVDDDQGFRKTLSDILKVKGYTVTTVATGQAALAKITIERTDIVLIDLKLEDMSGLDLLKALKQKMDSIECILLTGHATKTSAIQAVNLGAYGFLQKPYDVEQLLLMIRRAIEKQEAEESLRMYAQRLTTMHQQVQRHASELEQRITELQIAQKAERDQRELAETLREVTSVLSSSLDREQVLRVILEQLGRVVAYDSASVMLISDDNTLEMVAYQSQHAAQSNLSLLEYKQLPHVVTVLEQRKPVIIQDVSTNLHWRSLPLLDSIHCWLGVPLVVQNRVIGLLNLNHSEPNFYTDFDAELATALADQAAIAVENAQLFEQAQLEIKERLRAEAALEAERASLTQRVEDRTAALQTANTELARASQLKDEFLASMSHELRTPLNAILGLSEALQEQVYGTLNAKQLKSLHTIEESGRHLLALINDILDISKIEAEKLTLHIGPIPVDALCQASLRLINQEAQKKQITVSYTCDSAISSVHADQRRLKQILVNLLSNAVKFTFPGGQIGLDVIGDVSQRAICFVVWDTGIGISAEDQERLFEPFIQLDSSLARQYAGTGLGLALVRRLAELHGGQVWAESEAQKGSRFTVSLPWVDLPEEVKEPALLDMLSIDKTSLPSLKQVLIVVDSPTDVEQLVRYLTEMDIKPVVHNNAEGVVKRAQEIKPDVIILDIILSDNSGWEVLKRLQKAPVTQHIPVIVMSIIDEPPGELSENVVEYLVKPISRPRLQAGLQKIAMASYLRNGAAIRTSKETPLLLLVEDNPDNIFTMMEYLNMKGYQTIEAYNGQEAILQAKEARPDIILMDIQMPDMDGLEAIKNIRADTAASGAAVPIIALTALSMPGDRQRCLDAGADAYLSKPVRLEKLLHTIEQYLVKA